MRIAWKLAGVLLVVVLVALPAPAADLNDEVPAIRLEMVKDLGIALCSLDVAAPFEGYESSTDAEEAATRADAEGRVCVSRSAIASDGGLPPPSSNHNPSTGQPYHYVGYVTTAQPIAASWPTSRPGT